MKLSPKKRSFLGMIAIAGLAAACVWLLDDSQPKHLALLSEGWQDQDLEPVNEETTEPEQSPVSTAPLFPAGQSEPTSLFDEEIGINNKSSTFADQAQDLDQLAANNDFAIEDLQSRRDRILKEVSNVQEKPDDTSTTHGGATDNSSNSKSLSTSQLDKVKRLIENGEDLAAHKKLSTWYWTHPQDRPRFQQQIEELANSIYLSPQPLYEEAYKIQPGDQLRKIAQQYKLSWKYLARLNRVNPRKIRAGQKLKVVRGPFDAVVDLSEFQLTILCQGQYVRNYRVGIGKDGSSPIGKFTVKDKLEDPVYYGPDGVIANNDPENPLGERWIDIGDSFGIHGTIDPESIGKSESRGCIRMLNEEVEEVYDFLTVGSTVWIRR